MDDAIVIVAAIAGSNALTALVTALVTRRKNDAETGALIMQSVNKLVAMKDSVVESLDAQVQSLARRVTEVEERLSREQRETRRLRRWVGMLLDQIRHLGVEPVAEPTDEESPQ